jgi:hypothetical protein
VNILDFQRSEGLCCGLVGYDTVRSGRWVPMCGGHLWVCYLVDCVGSSGLAEGCPCVFMFD